MKIIHLSDTHVGRDNNGQRLQALLDDITSLGNPVDHLIVHTGDLNDNASLEVMQQSQALLEPLLAQ